MTPDAYARFYQSVYRELVSQERGRPMDPTEMMAQQRSFGASLGQLLRAWGVLKEGQSILDAGGSTGEVVAGLGPTGPVAVLDPSATELAHAASLGYETIPVTLDQWFPNGRTWDVVLCLQTLDHCLYPKAALHALRSALVPGGFAVVTALDAVARANLAPSHLWKIDHPCYFSQQTFKRSLINATFAPMRAWRFKNGEQMGYLCAGA
jgi:SAM-dependent methyltransferase